AIRTPAQLRLTPTERRVAAMAGKGMRNAEIAAQLVVSVKTIETHLYRVFSKLGISRRFELAGFPLGVDGPTDADDQ
ncbi:MAG: helix-turn-helix transcriptional regulator, partial [Candidatus Dormiibacterota bacterium]